MYNGVNGIIGKARGYHDPLNSVAAGAITGAVFKSTGKPSHRSPFPLPFESHRQTQHTKSEFALTSHLSLHFHFFSWFACRWISRWCLRSGSRYLGLWQREVHVKSPFPPPSFPAKTSTF